MMAVEGTARGWLTAYGISTLALLIKSKILAPTQKDVGLRSDPLRHGVPSVNCIGVCGYQREQAKPNIDPRADGVLFASLPLLLCGHSLAKQLSSMASRLDVHVWRQLNPRRGMLHAALVC